MTKPNPPWTFRSWEDRDGADVAALVGLIYRDDPIARNVHDVHGPASNAPGRFARTLVATVNGGLAGVGTLWESAIAPARWRLSLQVHPSHRRQGIGTVLLDALAVEAARRDGRALQVGLSSASKSSVDFFVSRGFRYLMRTRLGTLDPTRIPESTWIRISDSERWADRLALRIRSLANVEDRVAHTPGISDLHAEIYQQTHAWSPPAPLDPETATAIFLGDDLIPEALFVAFDGDRPIGVSSVRRGESAPKFDLGWTGVLAEFGSHAPDLTLALLGHTLMYALTARRSITIEVDAADEILWNLIGSLPMSYRRDWMNLERPNSRLLTSQESRRQ